MSEALRYRSSPGRKKARKDLKDCRALSELAEKLPLSLERLDALNAEIGRIQLNVSERVEIFEEVKGLIKAEFDIEMDLYGSTLTGTCIGQSDVNIQVFHPDFRPNKLLSKLSATLQVRVLGKVGLAAFSRTPY